MLQDPSCNVVECGDRDCKLCTALPQPGSPTQTGGFPVDQAYCVYTCESPDCSLCRVETDVLLDLFCPFNSDQDIKEMMRSITSLSEASESGGVPAEHDATTLNAALPTMYYETTLQDEGVIFAQDAPRSQDSSQLIRELLMQTNPVGRDVCQDIDKAQKFKVLDETSLMDLALELQVDKMDDLPELKEQGLIEFI